MVRAREGSGSVSDFQVAKQFADDNGLVIIQSRGDVLQFDIDDIDAMKDFEQMLPILRKITRVDERIETKSKNGRKHVYLKTDVQFLPEERIAIQACMGSDRKRELLSLRNVRENRELPIFLYETEEASKAVEHLTPGWQQKKDAEAEAIFS